MCARYGTHTLSNYHQRVSRFENKTRSRCDMHVLLINKLIILNHVHFLDPSTRRRLSRHYIVARTLDGRDGDRIDVANGLDPPVPPLGGRRAPVGVSAARYAGRGARGREGRVVEGVPRAATVAARRPLRPSRLSRGGAAGTTSGRRRGQRRRRLGRPAGL